MAVTPSPQPGSLPQFASVVRSEFRKLRSVRSTFWTLAAVVAFNVAVAVLLAAFLPGRLSDHQKVTMLLWLSRAWVTFRLPLGVLGGMVPAGCWGCGQDREGPLV